MNTFQSIGARLLAQGYLIIPIAKGQKRPAIDGWQNARLTAADLYRYQGSGVGILTGQGATPLCGVDIDTSWPDLAEDMVAWLASRFGMTVTRVGNAPKVLAVYRQARPFRKAVTPWFEDYLGARHRLEILGTGQQFVAYAIHPDTGKPYQWDGLLGGLVDMRPEDLPVLSSFDVAEILNEFAERAARVGLKPLGGGLSVPPAPVEAGVDDGGEPGDGADAILSPLEGYTPPLGLSIDQARELVRLQDPAPYDTWLRVGQALHHEFHGRGEFEAAALGVWDEWSQGAPAYKGWGDLESRWHGFGRSAGAALGQGGPGGSRRGVTMRSLVKAAADLGPAPLPGEASTAKRAAYPYTEFGNADRLVDQYGQGLMFVPELGRWYVWTGVYWRQAADAEMRQYARLAVEAMREEGEGLYAERREALQKWQRKSQTAGMLGNMLKLAEASPLVLVAADALDRERHLLGVENGAIDLRTGELLPPDPHHRLTRVCRVPYDPTASCPLWERTLYEVFQGDAERVAFLQRLLGYVLLGQPDEDVIVILLGMGANGKSTVTYVVRHVLGGYAATVAASTVVSDSSGPSNSGTARPDLLRLAGVRFAAITEPDEGSELREGFVKSVTGGEPIVARNLYSSTFVEVLPSWVPFMATNHRPIIKGDDLGIWRRILLLPFEANFEAGATMPDGRVVTKDPERQARLLDEGAGILAWMVRGCLAYQREGLAVPAALDRARQEYRTDMDLLAVWIQERCRVVPLGGDPFYPSEGELLISLWLDWQAWASTRGELRMISSAKQLARRLRAKGFVAEHAKKGLAFLDICLKTQKIAESGDA